jgi:hypothetical protein
MGRWAVAAAGLIAALTVGGCGLQLTVPTHPVDANTTAGAVAGAAGTSSAPAPRDHEVPTPPGRAERAPGLASPAKAVRSFAASYINWNAGDVAKRLTVLARHSVGQARTELKLEAAETRADRELHRGDVANRGDVESVAPLHGRVGGHRYVVVTLERTTAAASTAYDGLAAAWHVTVATVRSVDHGRRWVVSAWQPES